MPATKNILVRCDQIDPPKHARKLDQDKVDRLAKSIATNGLLQSPGVVATGDRYRLVYGNHRLHAWIKNGHDQIEVRLLGDESSDVSELSISLQENHVREAESFDDALKRVEQRAKELGCSFSRAAELEQVKPAYVSRARKIVKQFDSKTLEIAKAKKVGFSVLYELSKENDLNRRTKLLASYIDGSMNRQAIAEAVKNQPRKEKPSKLTLTMTSEHAVVKIVVAESTTHECIQRELATRRKELATHQKNGIPVKLLPEILKGGQANVDR